jgi:hypothetical protein
VFEQLRPHGFRVADIAIGRFAHRSFAERAAALGRSGAIASAAGPVAALDVLFVRDLTTAPGPVAPDTILKSAMMLELYGLNDAAHDRLIALSACFPKGFDVTQAADRLIYQLPAPVSGIAAALRDLGTALRRSWRYRRNRRTLR